MTPVELARLRDKIARTRVALDDAHRAAVRALPQVTGYASSGVRYKTDEERQAARRRSWREAKRRRNRIEVAAARLCARGCCGNVFVPDYRAPKDSHVYCSKSCRWLAWHDRKQAAA